MRANGELKVKDQWAMECLETDSEVKEGSLVLFKYWTLISKLSKRSSNCVI